LTTTIVLREAEEEDDDDDVSSTFSTLESNPSDPLRPPCALVHTTPCFASGFWLFLGLVAPFGCPKVGPPSSGSGSGSGFSPLPSRLISSLACPPAPRPSRHPRLSSDIPPLLLLITISTLNNTPATAGLFPLTPSTHLPIDSPPLPHTRPAPVPHHA